MKKKILPILILSVASLISGCNNKDETINPVYLSFSTHINEEYIDLTYEQFADRMNIEGSQHVESFLILTYNNCGCASTTIVKSFINSYVKDNNVVFYAINGENEGLYDYYSKTGDQNKNHGLTYRGSYPTVHVVENGVVKYTKKYDSLDYDKDAGLKIKTWIEQRIHKSKLFLVNEEYLEKDQIEEAVIYFGRSGCGDCQYVEPNFIFPYLKTCNSDVDFYYFDIQSYWASSTDVEKYQAYCAFKDKWKLSTKGSDTLGYSGGVVPTFQYIKNGVLKDACVYSNDSVEKSGEKVLISESYYHDRNNPFFTSLDPTIKTDLVGVDVTNDVIEYMPGYFYLPTNKAAKNHDPILKGFLDYYLK